MKFTIKEDFLHGARRFEEGNTHDSAKLGLGDAEVDMFYKAGWVEIEGRDPAPPRDPNRVVTLDVQSVKIGQNAGEPGVK